jgi:hypothetical protein
MHTTVKKLDWRSSGLVWDEVTPAARVGNWLRGVHLLGVQDVFIAFRSLSELQRPEL